MNRAVATFTLDGGHAPRWLFERMVKLGREMSRAIVDEYGPEEYVRRLGDPVWFQSLGTVLAFDWNASGLTTILTAALKEAIRGEEAELGIFICGGKGATSRKTPAQINAWGERLGLPGRSVKNLEYNSRMSAKVDSALIQDGYQLYHHAFFFTNRGAWTVVQQGMNQDNRTARRYHWHSRNVRDLVVEPHSGIASQLKGRPTLNLTAGASGRNRQISVELVAAGLPSLNKDFRLVAKHASDLSRMVRLRNTDGEEITLLQLAGKEFSYHQVATEDFSRNRYLQKILSVLSENMPENYEKLLSTPGVGAKTTRALSLVAEVIYGAEPSYTDPARYSFAHGGKDATPYPVDRPTYDQTIETMRRVQRAKLSYNEKSQALARLK